MPVITRSQSRRLRDNQQQLGRPMVVLEPLDNNHEERVNGERSLPLPRIAYQHALWRIAMEIIIFEEGLHEKFRAKMIAANTEIDRKI